ncbi:mut7-c ubiquitin [Lucifera butyrica]|uniref:Mut7-c ubiquitin n=1 Tax=Lucifera butyrica TaxID=1351585 RepID=A0A498RFM0_9FIRM|nr:MoaD/ThiS family protein [Lucifera butyrica]VBB09610.1 mut7-c ubiquitin [Lucifera butyrica]
MPEENGKFIEVRGFLQLNEIFRERNWPIPLRLELEKPTSGRELAKRLEIPETEIEIVFVNGVAQSVDYLIQPGDRVAFVPPGCPGPYRIVLGFYAKNRKE